MIASAPAWAVWLALGLWGVAIVVGVVAFVMARRLYRRFKPMVEPYLLMFVQASQPAAGTVVTDKPIGSSPAADTAP